MFRNIWHKALFFCLLSFFPLYALAGKTDTVFTSLPASQYAITATGLPTYEVQLPCGAADAEAEASSYAVSLDYPEYQWLTGEEARLVRQLGLTVADSICPTIQLGVSRKRAFLEVRFCPIVVRNGRMARLVSCKLVPKKREASRKMATKSVTKASALSARWASSSVLATGRWVKIRVSAEGIYELTSSQLAKWGFSDISCVKLYGYGGRIQPEAWSFTDASRVPDDLNEVPLYRRDGSVLFYAEGTVRWTWNTQYSQWVHEAQPYSRYSYYFLTEGNSPLTFEQLSDVASAASTTIESFPHHALLDNDAVAIYAGGRQLYDDYDFSTDGATHTYSLAAPSIQTGQSSKVCIAFGAANQNATTSVQVALSSGETIGTLTVGTYGSDESGRERRQTFTTTALTANNRFAFTVNASATARLNYIRLTYPCAPSAASLTEAFTPNTSGAATLSIADATTTTRLWRLGDADNVVAEVYGSLNGTTYEAHVPDASQRFVIVDISKEYSSPEFVGEVTNQNLHADTAADMIIIVPESGQLEAQATRLAQAHIEKDGLRVRVVNAGQLYNEYSSGTPDASAYRRYLKMLYDRAETDGDMPRYLLLFGDCAWDNRMLTSDWATYSPTDFLLSFEVNDGYSNLSTSDISLGTLRSYVTDDFYTWLDDAEGTSYSSNKPDVAVGRFLCHDEETATILVDKAIAYMNNDVVGAWKNRVYVLGDDGDNNLHMRGAEEAASAIQEAAHDRLSLGKVYWDAYARTASATGFTYPQVTAQLQEYMRKGALLFNYIGHGSPDQISHSLLLKAEDFAASSSSRFPLWIMASCEICPFDSQREDIGRIALYNQTGGAIALVCASRSVYASSNTALNNEYLSLLLDISSQATFGEALRQTKVNLLSGSGNVDASINKLKYVLLGDPALTVSMPRAKVMLDSINGQPLTASSFLTLKAGSVVRFSGHVCTDNTDAVDADFGGTVTATLSDCLETVTCLNNQDDDVTPLTFQTRSKTVYESSDSVTAGQFVVTIPIPRDISYTDDAARISFYAVNTSKTIEANGFDERFALNGTADSLTADTVAPTVYPYFDTPDFMNGGITSTSPTFMADISDDAGLNVSGISVGHDLELVLDGQTTETTVLNDYFTYTFGDYRSGQIVYPMSGLSVGSHFLTLKAWDVNNNATTARLDFYVSEDVPTAFDVNVTQNPATTSTNFVTVINNVDGTPVSLDLEVYDVAGRRVWLSTSTVSTSYDVKTWHLTDTNGSPLPAGLYLYRAKATSSAGSEESDTKKIIIVRQ